MDPTTLTALLATTPFKSPPSTSPIYGTWDHRLSPYAYFERTLGKLVQTIDDTRDYSSGPLLAYLALGGAQLVESSKCISDGNSFDEVDTIDRILADVTHEPYGGLSYYLYWYKGCLLQVEGREGEVTIDTYGPVGHPIEVVHREFEPFLAPRKRAAVSVLLNTSGGMVTKSVDFEPPVIDDLELNYGTGFSKVDKQIVGKLEASKAGLFLFHGNVGTGKTSYIKHLTTRVDREFIFIPTGMAGELSSPSFLSLLLEHQNAILVLEDAEQALQSREVDHWNSAIVSTLLNVTDGLLGSLLHTSVLATYNCEKQMIDKALLRKGRLAFDYTFDKLSAKDAQRLAVHLKKDPSAITDPTSLADIYNAEDDTGYVPPVQKTMGFGGVMV